MGGRRANSVGRRRYLDEFRTASVLAAADGAIAVARDGQTGLDLATEIEYDLILVDWQVSKLDGISLCRQLRSRGYSKPILMLAAKNSGDFWLSTGVEDSAGSWQERRFPGFLNW